MQHATSMDKAVNERGETVNKDRLCWNCLLNSHQVSNFKFAHNFWVGNKRHQSLLHHETQKENKLLSGKNKQNLLAGNISGSGK